VEMRKRILYVESRQDLLESIRGVLRPCCYDLVISNTAEDALRLARIFRFDLFILGAGLPEIDEIELCVRMNSSSSAAPVMIYSEKSPPLELLEAGAHYLKLPADPWDLEQAALVLMQKTAREGINRGRRHLRV
jgi:DNA-binding response OmpR family regulator